MEMDLVKNAYYASQLLSNLRLRLLWDEKLQISKGNYIALKIFLDNCKEKIDDIIDMIEKYCKDEKKIDSIEKVIEKYIENIIDNILDEERE